MKNVELEFTLVFENHEYAVLHRIAKSKGLTVDQYLIKCLADLVNSWGLRSA
jgi:hypothetical protein